MNYLIEAERFFGAIVILCHHIMHFREVPYFSGGWIFVEFFFMLTGYFSVAHFERGGVKSYQEKDVFIYMIHKAKRFFPYVCISVTLSFLFRDFIANQLEVREIVYDLAKLPFYYLGLIKTGIAADVFSMQLWYLTEVLLFLPLLLVFVIKRNSLFRYFLAWFLPVMIYAGLLSSIGSIPYWNDVWMSNLSCALRGIAGMCIGACLYYICKSVDRNVKYRAFPYICFALLVLTACFADVSNMSVTPFLLGASAIAGAVCNDRNSKKLWIRKLCIHMGRISLPIYCLHYQVMQYVHFFCDFNTWSGELAADLLITIVLSEICMNTAGRILAGSVGRKQ